MMKPAVQIFIALQFIMLAQMRSSRFQLEINNMSCTKLTKLIKLYNCTFRKVAENQFAFRDYMIFAKDLGKELEARIKVQFQLKSGRKPRNFIDMKMKVCDVLMNPFDNRMLGMLINNIKISSNFPQSCPLKGNVVYTLANLTVTDEYFPAYLPFLNFTYIFELYNYNSVFASAKITGALVPAKQ